MNTVRHFAALAISVAPLVVPTAAFAQVSAISDSLNETIVDTNTGATVPVVPLPLAIIIPEQGEPVDTVYSFPGREINFLEIAAGAQLISDRLSISPFQVRVASDGDAAGLPPRTSAHRIPASALESFLPLVVTAHSDGEATTTTLESDHLSVLVGAFGRDNGILVFDGTRLEPFPEGAAEDPLLYTLDPIAFDIVEPLAETGGVEGIISDYVDIVSPVAIRLISSDDQAVYANLPPAHGSIIENIETGGGVRYAVNFQSDAVPEPTAIAILGIALLWAGTLRHRRLTT